MSEREQLPAAFEHNLPIENERKYYPHKPEVLLPLIRHEATVAIEQVYLSAPGDDYNLRLREYCSITGDLSYEATLKDRGTYGGGKLARFEVTTPISAELYNYYKTSETPVLRKLRAEPYPGITVDFYEDNTIQVESESDEYWHRFTQDFGSDFEDSTGSPYGDNERKAHDLYIARNGRTALEVESDVTTGMIVNDILNARRDSEPLVVHIGGRSGSGKSTIVRELVLSLQALGVSSNVLSTDDYHRGARWLTEYNNGVPWERWDERIVYDLKAVRRDLESVKSGKAIHGRAIDWIIAESVVTGELPPADVTIIEGIYATDTEIVGADNLSYVLQTPLATCIGRRLLRDLRERPQFADAAKSLRYMLTEAEPAYRKQHGLASETLTNLLI